MTYNVLSKVTEVNFLKTFKTLIEIPERMEKMKVKWSYPIFFKAKIERSGSRPFFAIIYNLS